MILNSRSFDGKEILTIYQNWLVILIGIVAISVVVYFPQRNQGYESRLNKLQVGEKTPLVMVSAKSDADFPALRQQIKDKKVFSPGVEEQVYVGSVDKETISACVKSLLLTGVISGDVPQVIIEDASSGRTYSGREQEAITENITIKKIKKDSVEIECYGQNVELKL